MQEFTKVLFLDGLTDKYGKETNTSAEPGESSMRQSWTWIFPTTTIALSWLHYREENWKELDRTTVIYQRRQKMDDCSCDMTKA